MQYGDLLMNLFQVGSSSFSLWTMLVTQVTYLDTATAGLFLGLCIALPIVLVYQKTDSLAQIYGLIVISLNFLRVTMFDGQVVMLFYILILVVSLVLYKLYTTLQRED